MDTHVLLGPDNYDRIKGWRIYEVSCDDPGLSKPAFLASKSAEHPVQAEVSALDYYIEHFVWGGLQRTTAEEYAYAIYGIPDWKQNRESADPGRNGRKHFWRIYDYPHVTLMYFSMYRVAKHQAQIRTALSALEYLRRAYGTAVALFTIPYEIERWSAYQTGIYNELVITDLIDALESERMPEQAERLRMHWERKVRSFIGERPDLFRSEYAFDTTGFESTHALAKYALLHADRLGRERPANERMPALPRANMQQFLEQRDAGQHLLPRLAGTCVLLARQRYPRRRRQLVHADLHVADGRLERARLCALSRGGFRALSPVGLCVVAQLVGAVQLGNARVQLRLLVPRRRE
jgi:hypothetical protein